MSKHTTGPWKVSGHYNTGEGHTVTHIHTGAYSIEFAQGVLGRMLPETHANARLIAAAPDLLEAARAALDLIESWSDDSEKYGDGPIYQDERFALMEAIAKADPDA